MRNYGSVHTQFWTDKKIKRLSMNAKFLALYLLTSPHSNMLGCYWLPKGYIAEAMQWSKKRVSNVLAELNAIHFLTYDEESDWVLLHNYLKWNPIENPNQGKGVSKLVEIIPTDAEILIALHEALNKYSDHLEEELLNRLETVVKALLNQDQEQEPDQYQQQEFKNTFVAQARHEDAEKNEDDIYLEESTAIADIPTSENLENHEDLFNTTQPEQLIAAPVDSEVLVTPNQPALTLVPTDQQQPMIQPVSAIYRLSRKNQMQVDTQNVFEHWKITFKHARTALDSKRRKLIRRMLRLDYTVDDLCTAITGCSLTPHNQGHNDNHQIYDGLHIILRDADQVDRFMRNAKNPPKPKSSLPLYAESNRLAAEQCIEQFEQKPFSMTESAEEQFEVTICAEMVEAALPANTMLSVSTGDGGHHVAI